jgi:uncharacterized repeat protein (TIGR01451 family)
MGKGRWTRYALGVLGAALTVAVVAPSTASGSIVDTTGVVAIISPPASVKLDRLQSDTAIYGFSEQQGTTLSRAVSVDAVQPGTYNKATQLKTTTIPSGTRIDSHLFTSDPASKNGTAIKRGTVTFGSDILGVIVTRSNLASSDFLGAPGTEYPGAAQYRELELAPGTDEGDTFAVSTDRRTLKLDLSTPKVFDHVRVITGHTPMLTTSIVATPNPVTVGNNVRYTITVRNAGLGAESGVSVTDTLPADSSLVSATAPGGCSGSGPVTCQLGTIAPGASIDAVLVVKTPATMPAGNTITTTAEASPAGATSSATNVTDLIPADAAITSGFVLPGGSITTGGRSPATVTLPNTGTGAPITVTQAYSDACGGPCPHPDTTVADFPGYDDPNHPVRLVLDYEYPDDIVGAAVAFASANIYKFDFVNPDLLLGDCLDNPAWTASEKAAAAARRAQRLGTQSGIANPSACVDSRTISAAGNVYTVSFEVLYLSGDPVFKKR